MPTKPRLACPEPAPWRLGRLGAPGAPAFMWLSGLDLQSLSGGWGLRPGLGKRFPEATQHPLSPRPRRSIPGPCPVPPRGPAACARCLNRVPGWACLSCGPGCTLQGWKGQVLRIFLGLPLPAGQAVWSIHIQVPAPGHHASFPPPPLPASGLPDAPAGTSPASMSSRPKAPAPVPGSHSRYSRCRSAAEADRLQVGRPSTHSQAPDPRP